VFGQLKSLSKTRFKKIKFVKIPFTPPYEFYFKRFKNYETSYLLESRCGSRNIARHSFLGFNPTLTVKIEKGLAEILGEHRETVKNVEDPLKLIEHLVGSTKTKVHSPLIGGAVGYISYDAVNYWERLPEAKENGLNFPDIEMGIYDDGFIFDHFTKEAYYYYMNKNRLNELLSVQGDFNDPFSYDTPKLNISKNVFESNVEEAKRYIYSGDIFQIVISKRYMFRFKGDLTSVYLNLRDLNPSPYMYFIKFGDRQILGSSPEMLVRVKNRQVETCPIAGTRPVTAHRRKNRQLAEELLSDPKERAEHVMLVDLARNDLGRICQFGTVNLSEFMTVKKFSHVQHIVSKVSGLLKSGFNCYSALKATFPAGTVSGAPKIRAMELIVEIEKLRRGPYAGAVGYFSRNGNADFAITIRSIAAAGNKAFIQAGAGIVADSSPEREWFETEHKAAALLTAVKKAGERL